MQPKLDAQHILETLAKLRASIPGIDDGPDGLPAVTEEDYEYAAVLHGAEAFAKDLEAAVARMKEQAVASALEIYYALEERARDPVNTNLLPYLEEMRTAYERLFGQPIPEQEETCPK